MNRDDIKVCIHMVLIAALIALIAPAFASEEKPSTWFCIKARQHRSQFTSDRAAEDAARQMGASEATIARARGCRR